MREFCALEHSTQTHLPQRASLKICENSVLWSTQLRPTCLKQLLGYFASSVLWSTFVQTHLPQKMRGFISEQVMVQQKRQTNPKSKTLKCVKRSTNINQSKYKPTPSDKRTTTTTSTTKWVFTSDKRIAGGHGSEYFKQVRQTRNEQTTDPPQQATMLAFTHIEPK